jgi:hypothetical protein
LNESPQGFIGDIHFALLQQNLLNAAIASALPPPAENDRAKRLELGARLIGRQILGKRGNVGETWETWGNAETWETWGNVGKRGETWETWETWKRGKRGNVGKRGGNVGETWGRSACFRFSLTLLEAMSPISSSARV